MDKLVIVVPCYDEESTVSIFIETLDEEISDMPIEYELLFVDDGSKDNTLKIIREKAETNEKVKYIHFSRNFGKESAIYAGLCHAKSDLIAIMDVDLQDPPSLLPQMYKILKDGRYDCVATKRVSRAGEPVLRSFFARAFYWLINKISDSKIENGARDFRLMTKEMADVIISMSEYNRFSKGIFGWIGFNTYWISYDNIERAAGHTKWSMWGLFKYAVDGIVDFSQMPLKISSFAGIFMSLISFLMMVIVILKRLFIGDPVDGWASQVCIQLFIGGIQLFCMGIMGQYIAKTYLEVKKRPHFVISESNLDETIKIG